MEGALICANCNMVFRSTGLLEKHKSLFCIGGDTGHLRVRGQSSEHLLRNNGGDVRLRQARTPDLVQACGRQLGHSEKLKEMREMAELHERQLAVIHAHNQDLEQQRDELDRQVSVLAEQGSSRHLEGLLLELREQEERNEETLQQLAEHLQALQVQQISVPADQPDPLQNVKTPHASFDFLSSEDGPLYAQIKALQLAYMQSGGADPDIVSQLIDLQAEAHGLEKNQSAAAKARKKKMKPLQRGPSWELLSVEQENQRLEEELLRIQLAREKHHDHEASVRMELQLVQRENLHHMAGLQAELESLGRELERNKEAPRPHKQPPPPPLPLLPQAAPHPSAHIHAPVSLLQARSLSSPGRRSMMEPLHSLGPAPYDPASGFVIFYDFVLGVDASQKALRLVAALYSDGEEVGRPSPLPAVQCLPGGAVPYSHSLHRGNYGVLSVKQPVPRLQPLSSLCLLLEVQAARELVYGNEALRLGSWGWTRLDLFDQYNQLQSGHWRVPVRSLPIRPTLSLAQLNSVPQVGGMEVCVRVVNGRDGDVQTLVRADPTMSGHYKYPAVGNGAPPVSSPEGLTGVSQLPSLLPFTEHQDETPGQEASHI
ncbi:coiled-coil domain-containing protein 17 [Genypterus blacodes]|uniref:coiled-coil domain-containing protein 17 n=1 Tax=Genypterus blacodes TaxID=154954 RepID=UPI003F75F5E3